jgi:predicted Fe-Mo cluster-binding NifX family protein
MKIAISSNTGKFNKPFSARFGRCDYFVIVDSRTRAWEAKPNSAATVRNGAGAQVVQTLSDNGVQAVISGRFGPNAHSALEAAGIQAYQAKNGTPEELLERFLAGELKQVHAPTGPERHRRGRSR